MKLRENITEFQEEYKVSRFWYYGKIVTSEKIQSSQERSVRGTVLLTTDNNCVSG